MSQQKKSIEELNQEKQELIAWAKKLNVDEERFGIALELCLEEGSLNPAREALSRYQDVVDRKGMVIGRNGKPIVKRLVF